jgi:hypothetical protein
MALGVYPPVSSLCDRHRIARRTPAPPPLATPVRLSPARRRRHGEPMGDGESAYPGSRGALAGMLASRRGAQVGSRAPPRLEPAPHVQFVPPHRRMPELQLVGDVPAHPGRGHPTHQRRHLARRQEPPAIGRGPERRGRVQDVNGHGSGSQASPRPGGLSRSVPRGLESGQPPCPEPCPGVVPQSLTRDKGGCPDPCPDSSTGTRSGTSSGR